MPSTIAVPAIHPDEAAADQDAILLDVRDDTEWRFGHAPTATHMAMREIPARLAELDRSRRIVCVCRSGNRSAHVTAFLRHHGYDAVNMTGGMSAWASFGHPLVMDDGRPGMVI